MSLLTILANDPDGAVDPDIVLALADPQRDPEVLAAGLQRGRLPVTAALAASVLTSGSQSPTVLCGVVEAVLGAGCAELSADLLLALGPDVAQHLENLCWHHDKAPQQPMPWTSPRLEKGEDEAGAARWSVGPLFDLFELGAPVVLRSAGRDDLQAWMKLLDHVGTLARGSDGKLHHFSGRVVPQRALVLWVLANPDCDDEALRTVGFQLHHLPGGEASAVLADVLADPAISDERVADLCRVATVAHCLVPAAILAGRTRCLPTDLVLQRARADPVVARWVTDVCSRLTPAELGALAALVDEGTGRFEQLVELARGAAAS